MEAELSAEHYPPMWKRLIARMLDAMFQLVLGLPFIGVMVYVVLRIAMASPGGLESFTPDMIRYTPKQSLVIGACSLGIVVVSALYTVLLSASKLKGTLGKSIMGMQVVGTNGERLTLGTSLHRFIALEGIGLPSSLLGNSTNAFGKQIASVSGFLYGVYFMASALVGSADPRRQTIHDKLAKTYVVYRKS